MAKYENIRELAKKQLQAVTESSDRWKAFLRTAAIAYNYSFPNQLLIHEQSPTATAVADIAYWNNNAGRWVKRGAHGIAVFDTRANSSRLRYLFDISDTIPRAEIPEALPWVITDQNWRPVWDKIVADNHADSIQSALLMLSTSCVAQRSAMFTTALEKAIDGSNLQWAKPDEQRQLFIQLITQSCLYMAALRCGVDTARLDLSALESVNQFDTNRIALCLGSACQQAARPLMQQIGSITREIDSVARAEKVRYYGDKQEETNNTKEVNNGVHDGERLPNPGADVERAADAGNREVRQPAAEISARERADGVRRDAAGGNAVPASGGDGQRSTPANRADDADADAAEHRPEPADRPYGLDAVDERLAEPSRGTGDAADLQPVIQEPQAESDTTPSAFSVPISDLPPLSDELILGLLAKESSSRADNAAILEYFNEHPDLAERSAFCKHCYKQIYTYLFVDDHTVGFIRHDMYLELWEGNYLTKTAQVNLTWDAVAAKIADLIEQGRLMVPIKATPVQQQMEQLTLTPEDSEKAGLPSHEQQAKNIDLAAEAKKWNKPIIDASGKYITEQDITDALCKGGEFEDSKFRIQQYLSAQVLPIEEDQARWLKKEYGIGGGTWIFRDGGHGFLDHMGKNLEITRRTEDGEYRRVLKWKEVAQRLRLLVYNDQYLTDAEKAPYQAWAAEQQAARAANDAALDHAKHAITDFCENEGLNEPNFSDLTRVEFAYSTTEDDEHEIQVYADLLRNEIRYEVDGNIVHIDYFQDNHELAAQGIENSAFSDFINTAEAEFKKHHPTTREVEKSPVTIGSTVYLEDARPFTVEEIGRENIHLRDESFPLVGRAVKYRNTKDSKENYILTENVRFSTDSHAHKHNLNIIVIGGSGSGKTRFYVKPNALQLIGSYLFLDPKGELTRTLGRIMETKGISVTVLDLVHFQGHYNPMAYLETDEDAIKLAFAIVNNTKPKDAPSGGDKFWDDSSVLLISALILYLMYEAPASEQNFSTLMYMILNCQVSENEMVENPLMMLFGELERRDPQHPAVLQFKSFMLGAKKTLQSILISAAANLYMFNSRKFAEMTSRDEMFLPRMGLEQRALFIVLPDNDTTFNFIATMLYTQLFDQLFRLADSTPEYNGALPIHVRLMMDEFANVALPKNFKNILAVCRSRNISCDIILQNIAQLKSLFKDDWEGIIGNCDTLLYLGGNEYGTYEYLSKILGKETERTKSQSIGKGSRGSSSDSLQTAGRELCMPDEIRRMRDDECLLLMRSEDPVIDKKYNLLHHPNVKYTPDAGGEPYVMPPDYMGDAVTITMDAVVAATAPEITEEMYEQLDYLEKHPEENYYENEENFSQYEQGD